MKMTKLVIFILIGCILTWPGTTISIRLNDFKFEYNCVQRNSNINWDTTITNSISLDIVEDNSNKILFVPYGSVDFMKTVSGIWSDSYNDQPTQKTTIITQDNIYYAQFWQNSYHEFLFTPQRTGNYVFETFGTDTDTVIELCADGSSNSTTADDGGSYINSNGRCYCSKLSINLQANTLYRIKVKGYSDISKILLATVDVNEKIVVYERNLNDNPKDVLE